MCCDIPNFRDFEAQILLSTNALREPGRHFREFGAIKVYQGILDPVCPLFHLDSCEFSGTPCKFPGVCPLYSRVKFHRGAIVSIEKDEKLFVQDQTRFRLVG